MQIMIAEWSGEEVKASLNLKTLKKEAEQNIKPFLI